MKLMEALEEHDDVQKVYSNLDITDAVMAKFEGARSMREQVKRHEAQVAAHDYSGC